MNGGLASHTAGSSAWRTRGARQPSRSPWAMLVAALAALMAFADAGQAATLVGGTTSTSNSAPATSLPIARPVGTALGDFMLAQIVVRNNALVTVTPPPSPSCPWTPIGSQQASGGTLRVSLFYCVATAAEPATYTWNLSANVRVAGGIAVFRGIDTAAPINVHAVQAGSGTSVIAPSVTTTVANTALIGFFATAFGNDALGLPAAPMQRVFGIEDGAGPNGIAIGASWELRAPTGPTGARVATATRNVPNLGWMVALRTRPTLDHYAIVHSGTGLTCQAENVTITAKNASNVATSAAGRTITITARRIAGAPGNQGDWTLVSGTGTLNNGALNDGVATYTFGAGESQVVLALRITQVQTVNIDVVDGTGLTEASGAGSTEAPYDPNLAFVAAAFRVTADGVTTTAIGTHIAGKNSNVGFGAQPLFLQAISTGAGGTCTGTFVNQTVSVEMASQCNSPSACVPAPGNQVRIRNSGGLMVAIGQNNGGGAPASYAPVSLAFDAQSKAPLVFNYPDAGQITLFARYVTASMTGSSNAFVVRPFGLRIGVTGPGTGLSGAASIPTVVAGNNFNTTLTAVALKPGDDADADGQPDSQAQLSGNAPTPNFGLELTPASAMVSHALVEPAGGDTGNLIGTGFSGFSAGARTQPMSFSEVGIITLFASSDNYLGTGQNVTGGTNGLAGVGRFIPARLALSDDSLTNRVASGCAPASAFSYLDEGLSLQFTLTAENAAGDTTTNYRGAFARLPLTAAALGIAARDIASGTNLTARLDTAAGVSGSWSDGVASGATATIAVRRRVPDTPDGPFGQVKLGIAPVDPDGVALPAAALTFDADGVGGNDHAQVGADTQVRFGRLRMQNALGSERLALPVSMRVEYWNGTGFLVNALDSCTQLPRASVSLGGYQVNLNACETAFLLPAIAFANGVASSALAAPGGTNNGSVDLRVNLSSVPGGAQYCPGVGAAPLPASSAARSYLRGRWNDTDDDANPSTAYDDDPIARASFGLYGTDRAPNRLIYFRENY